MGVPQFSPEIPPERAGQLDSQVRDRYVELLKKSLTYSLWPEPPEPVTRYHFRYSRSRRALNLILEKLLARFGYGLVSTRPTKELERSDGMFWPGAADTMIGQKRMDNIEYCVRTVIEEDVPGDLIETGVWRGGACIFIRGMLEAYGVKDRRVFVADSFQGLPEPDAAAYPADAGDQYHVENYLAVSEDEVRENFERYGLFDEQVVFLKGWFKDTLPDAPIDQLAVLRLDGDMYGSTIEALDALYPKLAPGGFCIVDDYAIESCAQAVNDYREQHGIADAIVEIDWTGKYWRKTAQPR